MTYIGAYNITFLMVFIVTGLYVMARMARKGPDAFKILLLLPAYFFGINAPQISAFGYTGSFFLNFSFGTILSIMLFCFMNIFFMLFVAVIRIMAEKQRENKK